MKHILSAIIVGLGVGIACVPASAGFCQTQGYSTYRAPKPIVLDADLPIRFVGDLDAVVPFVQIRYPFLFTYAPAQTEAPVAPAPISQAAPPAPDGDGPVAALAASAPVEGEGVLAVLDRNCASCHKGSAQSGGVSLLDDAGRLTLTKGGRPISRFRVWDVSDGHGDVVMPPGAKDNPGKLMPAADLAVLRKWIASE